MIEGEKLISKELSPGKWKVGIDAGYEAVAVSLKGMRGRLTPLITIDEKEFTSRHPKGPDGKWEDSQFVLRGVPVAYHQYGHVIMLWPAPLHEWNIEITAVKRGKAAA
jgi:hypothetical protein